MITRSSRSDNTRRPTHLVRPARSVFESFTFRYLFALMSAMVISVWHAMQGKPRFAHIADTPFYWRAHIVALYLATLVTTDFWRKPWQETVTLVTLACGLLVIASFCCFSGRFKSRVLAANVLAGLAGWQVFRLIALKVVEFAELWSVDDVENDIFFALAVACGAAVSTVVMARAFKKLPMGIKKQGYRPSSRKHSMGSQHD